jgi:hypothetical protein
MKQWILALFPLAALVFGCGAQDNIEGTPDGEGDGADIPTVLGTAKQAIYNIDGWGADGNGNRCWTNGGATSWAGGICHVPNGFQWTVIIPDANHTGNCDADTRVGISNAALDFKNYMNALGNWNIQLFTTAEKCPTCTQAVCGPQGGDTFCPNVQLPKTAYIYCRTSGAPSASTLGATEVPTKLACQTGVGSGTGCSVISNGAAGSFLSYDHVGGPWIFETNWHRKSFYLNATSTQRRTFARNVVYHELFHVVGLGHDTPQETPLMSPVNTGASPVSELTVNEAPTQFEHDLLDCVNPNRNGLFAGCLL